MREIATFPIDRVTHVLLHGSDQEWEEVESMREVMVRISAKDGPAGMVGFEVNYANGSSAGVVASTVAGVRVG